jgi:hypothetical protein
MRQRAKTLIRLRQFFRNAESWVANLQAISFR